MPSGLFVLGSCSGVGRKNIMMCATILGSQGFPVAKFNLLTLN